MGWKPKSCPLGSRSRKVPQLFSGNSIVKSDASIKSLCDHLLDEDVEHRNNTAYDSGSVTLLLLGPGQCQTIIHVTLMVNNCLK